jgi:hypothetical protein
MIKVDLIELVAVVAASLLLVAYMNVVLNMSFPAEAGVWEWIGFWVCVVIYSKACSWKRRKKEKRT